MTMMAERLAAIQEPTSLMSAQELEPDGIRVWHWTREVYYRAAELGLLDPDARLELLDGEILQHMSPHKSSHTTSVFFTEELLAESARRYSAHVRTQAPISLTDSSEPEPDLVVASGTIRDYAEHHPFPSDIRLLVEVSDSTLRIDRKRKAAAYAQANIAEYWIVNLGDRQLEVYREPALLPTGNGYKVCLVLVGGDTVTPLFAPDSSIAVADLLPPAVASPR